MSKKQSVLIIAAHPDDEVLGMGATIAKCTSRGDRISTVFLASGIAARYERPQDHPSEIESALTALKKDAYSAAKLLKMKQLYFLDYPDNRLDTIAKMDIVHQLKKIIRQVRPMVVYTHHHGDYNWDHRIAFDVTLMACRANPGDIFPHELYSFEVLSSTERAYQHPLSVFVPTVFEDVHRTIGQKKKALQCYRSERAPYPHPRSVQAIENLAGKRGNEVGLRYAEAFELIRSIRG